MIHFQLLFRRFRTTWLFATLIFLSTGAFAQCIDKTASPRNGCLGDPVTFTSLSPAPTAFIWDFGDGTTDNATANPQKQYGAAGNYTVTLTTTAPNNCTDTFLISVYEKPVASLTPLDADTLCFLDNEFCFQDNSAGKNGAVIVKRVIDFGDGSIQIDDNPTTLANKTICHSYTVKSGQQYDIIIQVIDEHGCVHDSVYPKVATTIADLGLAFTTSYIIGCMKTDVTFIVDTGAISLADVSKFVWDFGDGSSDSGTSADAAKWTNFIHTYNTNGNFNATLTVTNRWGCTDVYSLNDAGANVFFEFDVPDSEMWQCFDANSFVFNQTPVFPTGQFQKPGDRLRWVFGDPNSAPKNTDTISFSAGHEFSGAGRFYVSLWIQTGPCDTTFTYDTVDVYGPQAIIETPVLKVRNKNQCMIMDTVYFTTLPGDNVWRNNGIGTCPIDTIPKLHNHPDTGLHRLDTAALLAKPPPYLSSHYKATDVERIWDFGDFMAPQCTTDTRNGIFVGVNCNWSKDSVGVRHWYTPGEERCYSVTLTLKDRITKCEHKVDLSLPLMAPDACPAPFATPPRRGLWYKGLTCLGSEPYKRIDFQLDETLPQCGRENFWIMWDSTCSRVAFPTDPLFYANGFVKNPLLFLEHYYTSVCDSNGFVTVGLILQNGYDVNCQDCFDTCWYNNFLRYDELNVSFLADFMGISTPCTPRIVSFIPGDSIQDSVATIIWNWRDGYITVDRTTVYATIGADSARKRFQYNPTGGVDSIILTNIYDGKVPVLSHSYKKAGKYRPTVEITTRAGCNSTGAVFPIIVGHYLDFYPDDSIVCIGTPIRFEDSASYWWQSNVNGGMDPRDYWHEPGRPEKFFWDFGDSTPIFTGVTPTHTYAKGGKYLVKLWTSDSSSAPAPSPAPCHEYDSLYVYVVDVTAGILMPDSAVNPYLSCIPQYFNPTDTSRIDSAGTNTGSPIDSITFREWIWGDGSINNYTAGPPVNLTPNHIYLETGTYPVQLNVQTATGCRDSVQFNIIIIGPTPLFEIKGDTIGCAPFTATFRNKSYDASSFFWDFGDSNVTTTSAVDTLVPHTYQKPGRYCVKIYATDSVINPVTGAKVSCNRPYPDLGSDPTLTEICVTVTSTPPVSIIPVKNRICTGDEAEFTNNSDPIYNQHHWYFGNPASGQNDSSTQFEPTHIYEDTGVYTVFYRPHYIPTGGLEECFTEDTATIWVTDVVADFDWDPNHPQPTFKFRNHSSANAIKFDWNFDVTNLTTTTGKSFCKDLTFSNDNPKLNQLIKDSIQFHCYGNDTNTFRVCLTVTNADGCTDSACKEVTNTFFIGIRVFNVFTPPIATEGDNFNDAFDIEIYGEEEYDLVIYNRWGEKVFEGKQDGEGNDGINWNGKLFNTGADCAEGVYYYVFNYKLRGLDPEKKNGSITLIR